MLMTLWRITTRHLSTTLSERTEQSFTIATKSFAERTAKAFAKSLYSDEWWEENLLTKIEEIGKLKAAEGIELPVEELDY